MNSFRLAGASTLLASSALVGLACGSSSGDAGETSDAATGSSNADATSDVTADHSMGQGSDAGADAGEDAPHETGSAGDAAAEASADSGTEAEAGPPPCMVDAGTTFLGDAIEISIGADVSCALRQGGQVVCWGAAASAVPSAWAALPADAGALVARDVVVIGDSACVLDASGGVWCAGGNYHGDLGNGASEDFTTQTPTRVVDGQGQPISAVKLGGGFDFGCALTATGSVLCWGDNDSKQLGQDAGVFDDAGSRYSNVALEVPGLSFPGGSILSSNLGEFECAQSASGIACWGDNSSGECLQSLALPTGFDTNVAGVLAEAGAALPVRSMALGEIHACALDGAGQVYCWGYGADGERGIPGYPPLAPNLVPGLVDAGVKQVACGRGWTCVLDAQSQVRCFGVGGAYGYLGNGPGEPVSAPDPVTVVDIDGGGALSSVARVYAGGTSTCAILTGSCGAAGPGPVVCWGYVPDLGAASVPEAGIPVPVLLP